MKKHSQQTHSLGKIQHDLRQLIINHGRDVDIETPNEELVTLNGVAVVIHLLHDSALLLLIHRNVLGITFTSHAHKLTLELVEEEHQTCARFQDQLRNQIHHRRLHTLALTAGTLNLHGGLGMRQDGNRLDFGQSRIHLSQIHLVDDMNHLNEQHRRIQRGGRYVRFVECVQELEVILRSLRNGFSARRMDQIRGTEMVDQDQHRMIVILRQREQVHRSLPLIGILLLTPPAPLPH